MKSATVISQIYFELKFYQFVMFHSNLRRQDLLVFLFFISNWVTKSVLNDDALGAPYTCPVPSIFLSFPAMPVSPHLHHTQKNNEIKSPEFGLSTPTFTLSQVS